MILVVLVVLVAIETTLETTSEMWIAWRPKERTKERCVRLEALHQPLDATSNVIIAVEGLKTQVDSIVDVNTWHEATCPCMVDDKNFSRVTKKIEMNAGSRSNSATLRLQKRTPDTDTFNPARAHVAIWVGPWPFRRQFIQNCLGKPKEELIKLAAFDAFPSC